ncbi:MAG: sugar phosphate isomerase/epimerase family protein, partial [Planctomycetota bacterium]
ARSRRSLEVLAEDAGRLGVRMAVENMIPRPEKRPCTRVGEILGLSASLGDHVGICLDTGHNHVSGANVAEEALQVGDKLFSVHMHDNHGRFDEDEHLLPGQGTIDWGGFGKALDKMGFNAPRIFEVNLLDGPDAPRRTLAELAKLVRHWRQPQP